MPGRETVVPKDMMDVQERFRYAPGVKAGPLLFVAGQLGRDEHLNVVEDKEAPAPDLDRPRRDRSSHARTLRRNKMHSPPA